MTQDQMRQLKELQELAKREFEGAPERPSSVIVEEKDGEFSLVGCWEVIHNGTIGYVSKLPDGTWQDDSTNVY